MTHRATPSSRPPSSPRPLPRRLLALGAGLALCAGSLFVGPVAATATSAASDLIPVATMPAGWKPVAVPHSSSKVPFVPVCPGAPSGGDGRTDQALEAFRTHGGLPALADLVATYGSAEPAFALVLRDLSRCVTLFGPGHRSKVMFTVSRFSFPPTGDQSVAFRASFKADPGVEVDDVVVRQGRVIMEITLSAKGTPETAQLQQFVALGLASLIHVSPG